MSNAKNTYKILKEHIERLDSELAKLNNMAKRNGWPVSSYEIVAESNKVWTDMVEHRWPQVEIVVSAEVLKFDGWRLIAAIEPVGDNANVVLEVPGEVCPAEYRTAPIVCEHCNKNIARKSTFIIAHDDGRYMMVGRNCLMSFTFGNDFHRAAGYLERLSGFMETMGELGDPDMEFGKFGRVRPEFSVIHIVALSSAIVSRFGWVSKTQETEGSSSTSSLVRMALDLPYIFKEAYPQVKIAQVDIDKARKVVEYVRSLNPGQNANSYTWDMFVLFGGHHLSDPKEEERAIKELTVPMKRVGFVASSITMYERYLQKVLEDGEVRESSWLGEVGKKHAFSGLQVMRVFDNEYYPPYAKYPEVSHMHILRDADGNVVKWSTGTVKLPQGWIVGGTGTVKAHDVYRGVKQTVVTRLSAEVEIEDAEVSGFVRLEETAYSEAMTVVEFSAELFGEQVRVRWDATDWFMAKAGLSEGERVSFCATLYPEPDGENIYRCGFKKTGFSKKVFARKG